MSATLSTFKTGLSALALVSCTLFTGCSPKLAPEGHYQDSPVSADGSPTDWSLPLRFSNANFTMQYNVTNDNKNLYVCVSSGDENTKMRILRSGMTLYFDPKGKKNKDINIHFPIQKQPDAGGYRSRGNGNGSGDGANRNTTSYGDRGARMAELLLQSDYYNTTGFLDMENGQSGVNDQKGPIHVALKLNNDDSLLVYEAIIPMKNILGPDWASRAAKKNFSVGVFIDATPGTGGGGGGGPRPGMGMRGMGMGMRGMGGGGGRRYGGGGGQGQKEDANWYTFRLVSK